MRNFQGVCRKIEKGLFHMDTLGRGLMTPPTPSSPNRHSSFKGHQVNLTEGQGCVHLCSPGRCVFLLTSDPSLSELCSCHIIWPDEFLELCGISLQEARYPLAGASTLSHHKIPREFSISLGFNVSIIWYLERLSVSSEYLHFCWGCCNSPLSVLAT